MMNTYQIISDLIKVRSVEKITMKVVLMLIFVYVFSYIIYNYYANNIHWHRYDDENVKITFIDSVFYTFSCWFTVGFGDIIPKTTPIKILSVIIMICAYIITLL